MISRPPLTAKMDGFGTTIFSEMTALAIEHDAVNLGQGFPDEDGPAEVLEAARRAISDGKNQYAPGPGVAELREAISQHGRRFHDLAYDPETEITVTFGATEAMSAAILAICDPGDEVLVVEPSYDAYDAMIALAGARRIPVPLVPPSFRLDLDRLRDAVSTRTRALIVNSPHNPTGSALTAEEIDVIADLSAEHDLLILSDEVYEHLVFEGRHRTLAGHPDARDRTVRISSAAKTFSATGWKIGWACAPPPLTQALRTVKQFLSFAGGTPFQHAVAVALRLPEQYFTGFSDDYRRRRDRLVDGLRAAGAEPYVPEGTFYVAADMSPVGADDGLELCRTMPAAIGVAAVPIGVFCADPGELRSWVRFATCKRPEVLAEGVDRLQRLRDAQIA